MLIAGKGRTIVLRMRLVAQSLVIAMLTLIGCRDLTGPNYHGDAISYVSVDSKSQRLVVITPAGRTLATYALPVAPSYAKLSPDHTMIALNDIASKLLVENLLDHSNRPILGASQAAGSVDWSADGKEVLFDNDYSHDEAWVVNADGSAAHAVSHDSLVFVPVWSPDGSRIAYDSRRDDGSNQGHYRLYIMNADGTGTHEVPIPVLNANDDMGRPAWSPDGNQLAFERYVNGTNGTGSIWIVNVDGTGARQLTQPGSPQMPSWSHDGKTIAYADTQIFTIDIASGRVTQVGSSSAAVNNTRWVRWR